MTIRWRPLATEDARDIWLYVAKDSPSRADALIGRMLDETDLLERHPLSGRSRESVFPELRSMTMGRYVIFYKPLTDGVEVLRLLHGARNLTVEDFA